jgi:hypothetical protein
LLFLELHLVAAQGLALLAVAALEVLAVVVPTTTLLVERELLVKVLRAQLLAVLLGAVAEVERLRQATRMVLALVVMAFCG